jgi:hypothetical protein
MGVRAKWHFAICRRQMSARVVLAPCRNRFEIPTGTLVVDSIYTYSDKLCESKRRSTNSVIHSPEILRIFPILILRGCPERSK